jgi:hypothetical protein
MPTHQAEATQKPLQRVQRFIRHRVVVAPSSPKFEHVYRCALQLAANRPIRTEAIRHGDHALRP